MGKQGPHAGHVNTTGVGFRTFADLFVVASGSFAIGDYLNVLGSGDLISNQMINTSIVVIAAAIGAVIQLQGSDLGRYMISAACLFGS